MSNPSYRSFCGLCDQSYSKFDQEREIRRLDIAIKETELSLARKKELYSRILEITNKQRGNSMENKTCGTCEHLGDELTRCNDETCEDDPTGYYQCGKIKQDREYEYKPNQKALTEDGSGYYSSLCVESDFGCVLWELKHG